MGSGHSCDVVLQDYAEETLHSDFHSVHCHADDAEYQWIIVHVAVVAHRVLMLKRFAPLALWFYAGWTLGAMLAYATGVNDLIGPVLGLTAAAMFAAGPGRLISIRR